jgi:hypothetical protein
MVDLDSKLNSFLVNLERRLDLPTPESPMSTTMKTDIISYYRDLYADYRKIGPRRGGED